MKKTAIKDALLRSSALTIGAAGSRVVADKLPVDNMHLKRGGLVLTGIVGASFVGRSSASKAFVQDMALGTAATQLGYWIKDLVAEKMKDNAIVTSALGCPEVGGYDNPVQYRLGYVDVSPYQQTNEEVSDVKFGM
ncbi:hypothetical protein V2647_06835 [Tenacibaculum maritimum]|uniref:hypothetical protein n=1 Tax=Tenacibaculum maritimum TaxID=107401 RepID=UPI003876B1E7